MEKQISSTLLLEFCKGCICTISVYNLPRLRTSTSIDLIEENGFILKKKVKSKQYPVEIITDADYADDITLLVNTPTQAETLLHSLEQATGGISLHVNAEKNGVRVLIKKEPSPL